MIKILPDTSFLVSCIEFKIDWEKEFTRILNENFKIIILDNVFSEIEKIEGKGGKKGKQAKLVKTIILTKKYERKKGKEEHTDDILLELSDNFLIITQDSELKKRVKDKGNSVGYIRQKKYVQIDD